MSAGNPETLETQIIKGSVARIYPKMPFPLASIRSILLRGDSSTAVQASVSGGGLDIFRKETTMDYSWISFLRAKFLTPAEITKVFAKSWSDPSERTEDIFEIYNFLKSLIVSLDCDVFRDFWVVLSQEENKEKFKWINEYFLHAPKTLPHAEEVEWGKTERSLLEIALSYASFPLDIAVQMISIVGLHHSFLGLDPAGLSLPSLLLGNIHRPHIQRIVTELFKLETDDPFFDLPYVVSTSVGASGKTPSYDQLREHRELIVQQYFKLKQDHKEMRKNYSAIQEATKRLEKSVELIKQQLNDQIQKMEELNSSLTLDNGALRKKIFSLEEASAEALLDKSKLNRVISDLTSERERLQKKISAFNLRMEDAQKKNQDKRNQLLQKTQELERELEIKRQEDEQRKMRVSVLSQTNQTKKLEVSLDTSIAVVEVEGASGAGAIAESESDLVAGAGGPGKAPTFLTKDTVRDLANILTIEPGISSIGIMQEESDLKEVVDPELRRAVYARFGAHFALKFFDKLLSLKFPLMDRASSPQSMYEILITGSQLNIFHPYPSDLDVLVFSSQPLGGSSISSFSGGSASTSSASNSDALSSLVDLIRQFSLTNFSKTLPYSISTKTGATARDAYQQIQWVVGDCRVDLNFSTFSPSIETLSMKQEALAQEMLVDGNAFYNLRTHQLWRLGRGDLFHVRCDLFKEVKRNELGSGSKIEWMNFISLAYVMKKIALNIQKPYSEKTKLFLEALNHLALSASRVDDRDSAKMLLCRSISYIFEKYWWHQSTPNQSLISQFLRAHLDTNQKTGEPLVPSLVDDVWRICQIKWNEEKSKHSHHYALAMGGRMMGSAGEAGISHGV
jgi:predicted  nucleic acid-binding Zn-ribbon protein